MSLISKQKTPLHRLHPADKIVLLVLYFVWAMQFDDPLGVLLPLAVALIGILAARAGGNARKALPLMIPITVMCLLLWSLLAGTSRGHTVLWQWGSLTIYREAVWYAVAMALRLNAMLLGGIVFISVTGIEELRLGLTRLGLPYSMAFATGLAFRLVPLIGGTLEKAAQAQKSRGFALDRGGPLARLRNHAPLIIPVILVSLRNIDQLAAALEARGFGAQTRRTSFLATPWRAADTACCVAAVMIIAGTILLRYIPYR